MNKHLGDCYLETNSNLGKIFDIPVFKIKGSIHDEIWLNKINDLKPDLIICARYGEILKKSLLTIPNIGVINFHPSLLPKYKGLGPIFQALLHDEKEVGFSLHYMDEGIDAGKIIKREKIKIEKNDKTFFVDSSNNTSFWAQLQVGVWEPETFKIFDIFLDKNHSYIDLGAWIGPTVLYGCQNAKFCYAVEPDPVAFKNLKNNIDLIF